MTRVEAPQTNRGRRGRRVLMVVIVLVALAVVGFVLYPRSTAPSLTAEQLDAAPKSPGPSATVSIPEAGPVLDLAALRGRIAAATTTAVGTAPSAVNCPGTVETRSGATFTCTATVDGAELPYAVTQTDDAGTVEFRARGWIAVRAGEKALVDAATANFPDSRWTATCAQGGRVVVGGAGTMFDCTLAVADNPVQNEEHTVRVTDDSGGFVIE